MTSYIYFQVKLYTTFNETVKIVGDCKELGEWDVNNGLQLETN